MGIAIVIFLVFLLLGMPVAFAIGISGFSFFIIRDLPMTMLVQKSISATQSFTMLAIPLFILAGNLMNATGITKRLMRLANVLTGHMYGNVGQVSCVLSTLTPFANMASLFTTVLLSPYKITSKLLSSVRQGSSQRDFEISKPKERSSLSH